MTPALILLLTLSACPEGRMRAVDTFRVCVTGEATCVRVDRSSLPAVAWLVERGWPIDVFFERRDWVCERGAR